MKVLVTGAGGQLATWVERAAPTEAEVIALGAGALDVTDSAAVDSAIDAIHPNLVFNCAGYTHVDRAESEPDRAFAVNRDGPSNLARATARTGCRLVHISTDFVFDGRSSTPYAPDSRPAPLGTYGASKLAGERAVAETAPDSLIVRTAWLYSTMGGNFVTTMLELMRERDEVRVVADQVGTPTHCASLARALWLLAGSGARGIHHFTDAGVASWYDFAEAIRAEAMDVGLLTKAARIVPIRSEDFPTAAERPRYSVLDKSGTWAELGAIPRHWRAELREALRSADG